MLTRLSAISLALLLGTAMRAPAPAVGSFRLTVPAGGYFPGSRVQIGAEGVSGRYNVQSLGVGAVDGNIYTVPSIARPLSAGLIGIAKGAVAFGALQLVPPPRPRAPLIAVASYRNGVALHDARTFAQLGNAGIGGAPGDVVFLDDGSFAAPNTDSTTVALVQRSPWSMHQVDGVPQGNEIAAAANGDLFVSNRDVNGAGALTRIARDGTVTRVITGVTAEGLALDNRRQLAYVGNVNDNSIAVVNAATMQVEQKIPTVERPFGIALDAKRRRLFVVSNVSPSMHAGGGYVAAIDVGAAPTAAGSPTRIVMRSAGMRFPLGIAFDARANRLFVTDEASDVVYVLNAQTLHASHAPLRTCLTPWRPRIAGGRLYIPCAASDRVDVFTLDTLRRERGAPFATGTYPLSVAVWP